MHASALLECVGAANGWIPSDGIVREVTLAFVGPYSWSANSPFECALTTDGHTLSLCDDSLPRATLAYGDSSEAFTNSGDGQVDSCNTDF